jgi:hypothetical protein
MRQVSRIILTMKIRSIFPLFSFICISLCIQAVHNALIDFDHSLLSPQGILTEQSLPIFLTQAYTEIKIHHKDFSNAKYLNIHKLHIFTTFYTLQIFLVIFFDDNNCTSTYIVKEAKNGASEAQHLQAIEMHPGIKELIIPAIPPQGLPSLILPFAYLSYRNQKNHIHYVTIMPAAKGISLESLIAQFRDNQSQHNVAKLARAYNTLGYELGNFHQYFMETNQSIKIGKTIIHGDFHCSNIFYNETENHCTFIDNETMAHSLEAATDAGCDIVKLFFDFFSIEPNSRKNMIKGVDLALWHDISLKSFVKGYLSSYELGDQMQVLKELKAIFNTDYHFSWFNFPPKLLQKLRAVYINPIFESLEIFFS